MVGIPHIYIDLGTVFHTAGSNGIEITVEECSCTSVSGKLWSVNRVWRVECRAGKDLLKDTWGIRTWQQFFARFGDLCRQSGEAVRYTDPVAGDTNRARWPSHSLWEIVCAEMNNNLTEMRSEADPNPMKEVHREQHIGMVFHNILGCSTTAAVLRGVEFGDLLNAKEKIANGMQDHIQANPQRSAKQLPDARERYTFVTKSDPKEQSD